MPRIFGGGKKSATRAVYIANTFVSPTYTGNIRARSVSTAGLSASNFSPDALVGLGSDTTGNVAVRGIDISPNGKLIAIIYNVSPYVRVYPFEANASGVPQSKFGTAWANPSFLPLASPNCVKFSPSGRYLLVASGTTTTGIIQAFEINYLTNSFGSVVGTSYNAVVRSIEFSPDGSVVFFGSTAVGSDGFGGTESFLRAYTYDDNGSPTGSAFLKPINLTQRATSTATAGQNISVAITSGSPDLTINLNSAPTFNPMPVIGDIINIQGLTSPTTIGGLSTANYVNGRQHRVKSVSGSSFVVELAANATATTTTTNTNAGTIVFADAALSGVTSISCSPPNNNNNPLWEGYVAVGLVDAPYIIFYPWFYATGFGTPFTLLGNINWPAGPVRALKYSPDGANIFATTDIASTPTARTYSLITSGGNWASWTNGSPTLTINLKIYPGNVPMLNGVAEGDTITIAGITSGFGGWTTAQLNATRTVVSVVDQSTFTVTMPTNAISTGTGGGTAGTISFNRQRMMGWVWDNTAVTGGIVNKIKNVTSDIGVSYGMDVSPDSSFLSAITTSSLVNTYKIIPSVSYPFVDMFYVSGVAGAGASGYIFYYNSIVFNNK